MTTETRLDVAREVTTISTALEARRDPAYEASIRRLVPSTQKAHATRLPVVREVARDWSKAHRDLRPDEVLPLCDALWATGWREERLVASVILRSDPGVLAAAGWERIERWSADIDNWEHVDNLADATGRMLVADGSLLVTCVNVLEKSENPWQRRLALVTLIVEARIDTSLLREMTAAADRLRGDKHPLVRKAVVWADETRRKLEVRLG